MDWFNSVSAALLNKDLDGLWVRQREISDNVSNIETPGYKSKSVSFEDQLKKLMAEGGENSGDLISRIESTTPQTSVSDDESLRLDGNNVDAEKENIELARTQINYYYSLRELSDYFSRLRYAITDGKA